jgi:hypothetical protein
LKRPCFDQQVVKIVSWILETSVVRSAGNQPRFRRDLIPINCPVIILD